MFLTNKKKMKLLDFEERVIKTKGYYGEDLELKVLSNKMLGNVEILAPNKPAARGKWVVREKEFFGVNGYRIILRYSHSEPMKFSGTNFILPGKDIESRLKTLANSAIEVEISLSKDLKVEQVEYSFLIVDSNNVIRIYEDVSVLYDGYLRDQYTLIKRHYE